MKKDYDLEEAFAAIENELISSMIRNMENHKIKEVREKKEWAMWQALQLEALEDYKKKNKKKFSSWFSDINGQIDEIIRQANKDGQMNQELDILKAIKEGFKGARKRSSTMQAGFFKLNERKLDALIKATTNDMKKAEMAILRMANDQYRKAIFNAQVYANSGAGTYEKAVDMAMRDMLSAGLNCVEYSNGARHTLKDYADMAIRTASKRAYLQGEGVMRQSWGISTVIMNRRGNPCPKCLPFCGKVLIDDVWSGGSAEDGPYPLMSDAIAAGLYHPRCKDSHTTYFEGVSSPPDNVYTQKEIEEIKEEYAIEQKQQIAKRNYEKYSRMSENSLDDENKKKYNARADEWLKQYKQYYEHPRKLKSRKYNDKNQFERYREVLGDSVSKSFAEFLELKYNNIDKWKFVRLDYKRRRELMLHPELKLPNTENVVLPEAKFTQYLFGGKHPEGLAKGRAISSRLGYDINNWQEFRDAIKSSSDKYPASQKEQTQHGTRYEQKIILYGLKGKPANVVIGWIERTSGEVSMTSAYIKEVK